MSFFYALTGVPPSPDAEQKRSRGRPRKDTSQRVADADTSGAEEVKEKRPRGRPPGGGVKEKTSPRKRVADDGGESSGSEDVVVEKRGRGRPPGSAKKAVRPRVGIMASANKAGRPRGRPSGSKNVQDDDDDDNEPLAKDAEYQDAVVRSIVRRPGAGRHGTGASNSHNEDLHREIRELRAKQSELMDLVRDLKAGQNEILGFVRNQ